MTVTAYGYPLSQMSDKQQRLVHSIIEFLKQSIEDGTVKQDDQESLEVASMFFSYFMHLYLTITSKSTVQCIGEAFGVDPDDQRLSIKPATLQTVFDVFLKTRDKLNSASTSTASPSPAAPKAPSPGDKAQAEKLKATGNTLMSAKKYDEAIASYSEAIALDGTNPVYYSNRAAAHSSKGDHLSAVGDAELAISVDPKFVKAYHRLGYFCPLWFPFLSTSLIWPTSF